MPEIKGSDSLLSRLGTHRDVLLYALADCDKVIVIACDGAGGIGPKPMDRVKVDGNTLGRFIARVAIMEVLATGAKPICLVDTVNVEAEPTGREILDGIKSEGIRAGIETGSITGHFEKNVSVVQSGLGVTALGLVARRSLKIGTSKRGDVVVAIGFPSVGDEVPSSEKKREIADTEDLLKIRDIPFVHEIIPVGSKGIAYEAGVLAEDSGLRITSLKETALDLKKSAGPSTVLLAAFPPNRLDEFRRGIKKPVNEVGRFE